MAMNLIICLIICINFAAEVDDINQAFQEIEMELSVQLDENLNPNPSLLDEISKSFAIYENISCFMPCYKKIGILNSANVRNYSPALN